MFTAIAAYIMKNPLGRKIALGAAVFAAFIYMTKLVTNHAYEQGREEGSRVAWIQAEERQKQIWIEANRAIAKEHEAILAQAEEIKKERLAFETRIIGERAKRAEERQAFETKIAAASQALSTAPAEADGLPPKTLLVTALTTFKEAYFAAKADADVIQDEYDQHVRLTNQEIGNRGDEIRALTKEVEQVKSERDFYKEAFQGTSGKKKRSFGHILKKIFTLGLAR